MSDKIGIIFVNGTYCSGKRKFSENLLKYSSETGEKFYLI